MYPREYLRRGWSPIPIPRGEKAPVMKDWQNYKVPGGEEGSDKIFKNKNIGMLLGKPSLGLTDIDCDCKEAVALAPYFLPDTSWIFGRKSTPRSHYLYICTDSKTTKYVNQRAMIVELRSTGAQTVFPGSVHPSGEEIQFITRPKPKQTGPGITTMEELEKATGILAGASLIMQHWGKGSRDELSVCLCGILLRAGWVVPDIDHFLTSICDAVGDEELDKRLKAKYQAERLADDQKVPGVPTLKKILGDDVAANFLKWMQLDKAGGVLEELNKQHAIVMVNGDCVVLRETTDPVLKTPDLELCTVGSLKIFYANKNILIEDKKVNIVPLWVASDTARRYDGIVFSPEGDIPGYYNMWKGFAVNRKRGNCQMYLDHIRENICDGKEDLYNWVVGFMADAVQNPHVRPGVSLVLRGGMGAGKGVLAKEFGKLFGPHFLQVANGQHLLGRFNAHLKNRLVLFADEAFWAGDKSSEGLLRALVTEETMMIEYKGVNAFTVRNLIRLIVASNHDWIVPAGLDERRFAILDVNDNKKGNREYFNKLLRQMDTGGREALMDYLMSFDLSTVDVAQIPMTKALAENKIRSADPIVRWWFDRLKNGNQLGHTSGWRSKVKKDAIFSDFLTWAQQNRSQQQTSEDSFFRSFKKLTGGLSDKQIRRTDENGYSKRYIVFTELETYREIFAEIVKGVTWK